MAGEEASTSAEKKAKKSIAPRSYRRSGHIWTLQDEKTIIAWFRANRLFYKTDHKHYRNTPKKTRMLGRFSDRIGIHPDLIIKRWRGYRSQYTRHLNAPEEVISKRKQWLFRRLTFLDKYSKKPKKEKSAASTSSGAGATTRSRSQKRQKEGEGHHSQSRRKVSEPSTSGAGKPPKSQVKDDDCDEDSDDGHFRSGSKSQSKKSEAATSPSPTVRGKVDKDDEDKDSDNGTLRSESKSKSQPPPAKRSRSAKQQPTGPLDDDDADSDDGYFRSGSTSTPAARRKDDEDKDSDNGTLRSESKSKSQPPPAKRSRSAKQQPTGPLDDDDADSDDGYFRSGSTSTPAARRKDDEDKDSDNGTLRSESKSKSQPPPAKRSRSAKQQPTGPLDDDEADSDDGYFRSGSTSTPAARRKDDEDKDSDNGTLRSESKSKSKPPKAKRRRSAKHQRTSQKDDADADSDDGYLRSGSTSTPAPRRDDDEDKDSDNGTLRSESNLQSKGKTPTKRHRRSAEENTNKGGSIREHYFQEGKLRCKTPKESGNGSPRKSADEKQTDVVSRKQLDYDDVPHQPAYDGAKSKDHHSEQDTITTKSGEKNLLKESISDGQTDSKDKCQIPATVNVDELQPSQEILKDEACKAYEQDLLDIGEMETPQATFPEFGDKSIPKGKSSSKCRPKSSSHQLSSEGYTFKMSMAEPPEKLLEGDEEVSIVTPKKNVEGDDQQYTKPIMTNNEAAVALTSLKKFINVYQSETMSKTDKQDSALLIEPKHEVNLETTSLNTDYDGPYMQEQHSVDYSTHHTSQVGLDSIEVIPTGVTPTTAFTPILENEPAVPKDLQTNDPTESQNVPAANVYVERVNTFLQVQTPEHPNVLEVSVSATDEHTPFTHPIKDGLSETDKLQKIIAGKEPLKDMDNHSAFNESNDDNFSPTPVKRPRVVYVEKSEVSQEEDEEEQQLWEQQEDPKNEVDEERKQNQKQQEDHEEGDEEEKKEAEMLGDEDQKQEEPKQKFEAHEDTDDLISLWGKVMVQQMRKLNNLDVDIAEDTQHFCQVVLREAVRGRWQPPPHFSTAHLYSQTYSATPTEHNVPSTSTGITRVNTIGDEGHIDQSATTQSNVPPVQQTFYLNTYHQYGKDFSNTNKPGKEQ